MVRRASEGAKAKEEGARAKERLTVRLRGRVEMRVAVRGRARVMMASEGAGRWACLVALLLLHHDGGSVLLSPQSSRLLDTQLLVQLRHRRLPRHRDAYAGGPAVCAAGPHALSAL